MIIDTTNWLWPQWTEVLFLMLNLVAAVYLNGERKTGTYSAVGTLISGAIAIYVLASGGFFK